MFVMKQLCILAALSMCATAHTNMRKPVEATKVDENLPVAMVQALDQFAEDLKNDLAKEIEEVAKDSKVKKETKDSKPLANRAIWKAAMDQPSYIKEEKKDAGAPAGAPGGAPGGAIPFSLSEREGKRRGGQGIRMPDSRIRSYLASVSQLWY